MQSENRDYLENTHDAYRLFYTILLTIGLGNGFSKVLQSTTGSARNILKIGLQEWAVFFLFVIIVLRFFLGGIRHLDREYLERDSKEILDSELRKQWYRLVDFGLLTFDAGLIILLGVSLQLLAQFFASLIVLLFVDALWGLGLSLKIGEFRREGRLLPRVKWGINNLIFTGLFIILFALLGSPENGSNWIWFVLAGLLNSGADILWTIDTYVPPLNASKRNFSD